MPELFSQDDDSFWETMGQQPTEAQEAAPADDDVADTAADESAVDDAPADDAADTAAEQQQQDDDRPRDPDTGRFLPRNLEVDDPRVQQYLAKYGGDPVKALEAAVEAQSTIGRLGSELGELRKTVEERVAGVEQRLAQPQQPITQDLIDRDPATATLLAYSQNNETALRVALDAWKDEDPFAAAAWRNDRLLEQREQQWQERYEQLEQRITPFQQNLEQQQAGAGLRKMIEEDPGVLDRIRDRADRIPAEVASAMYSLLENGTPEQRVGAFKALSELTKDQPQADTLKSVRDIAREQALEADRAIAEAAVVSATATKADPPKTTSERIGDEWDAMERPFTDGWNL